jgi:hypothetical protein
MADDNSARYRPDAPFGREPASTGQGNDPLAELARLIGKTDPFAELGRPAAPRDAAPQYPTEPAQRSYASESTLPPLPRFGNDPLFDEPAPRFGGDHVPPRYAEPQAPQADWPPAPAAAPSFPHDPFALPSAASSQHAPSAGGPHYDAPSFAIPPSPPPLGGYRPELPGFEPPSHQAAAERPPFGPPLYPNEPEAGAMPPPHDDEFYDDAPRNDRRKGMVTVLAVLGLAVLGTAAAFGYRSFFGSGSTSAPPPIIRASNEPSKVAPPQTAAVDPNANKISYDRFGDRGQNEQVVVREEKPIDTNDLARSTVPRTILPGTPSLTNPPQTANANPPSAIGEPRRVRTVPIRPDAPESASPSAATQAPMPITPQRQTTAAAPQAAPLDVTPSPPVSARASAAARTGSRSTPQRAAPQPPQANAPLSLSPDGNLPPPAAARETPPARTAAAARTAAPASGGRYLVQVSSQRSEADAEAAYRNLQSRFRNVLGGHGHVVRRADLGAKGVYYRAMVGPFASRDEAVQVCTSLKAAGGDCIVH